MMKLRGYDMSKYPHSIDQFYLEEAKRKQTDPLLKDEYFEIVCKHMITNKSTTVLFTNCKLQVEQVRNILTLLDSRKCDHCILIVVETPKAKAKSELENQTNVHIEIFSYLEFGFCLVESKIVPKHTILTEQQKQEIKKMYEPDDEKYPALRKSNKIVRFYDLPVGTMVEFERMQSTRGVEKFYRVVKDT